MKRALLVLLAAVILAHTPWRVIALAGETLMMSPGPFRQSTGTDQYWDELALEAKLTEIGYSVGVADDLMILVIENGMPRAVAVWGVTDKGDHRIMIDGKLRWNNRFAVLAHEAGHVLQLVWVSEAQGDAFAETVAMLVAHDGLREHARYLSRNKLAFLLMAVTESSAMYHAAAVLEDR